MDLTDIINSLIKKTEDTNPISDGYHTFGELYEHRVWLFITLCRTMSDNPANQYLEVWRSEKNASGEKWDGWFLLGLNKRDGHQISYHLPMKLWNNTEFAQTLDIAPEFDGHTSKDVLQRLMYL